MKLITVRDRIRCVADRWAKQYLGEGKGGRVGIRLALLDLETASKEDVDGIIGNDARG